MSNCATSKNFFDNMEIPVYFAYSTIHEMTQHFLNKKLWNKNNTSKITKNGVKIRESHQNFMRPRKFILVKYLNGTKVYFRECYWKCYTNKSRCHLDDDPIDVRRTLSVCCGISGNNFDKMKIPDKHFTYLIIHETNAFIFWINFWINKMKLCNEKK